MSTQTNLILNKIIHSVVKAGASCLHLAVGSQPIVRVDQKLSPLESEAIVSQDFLMEVAQLILSPDALEELNKNKSLIVTHTFEGDIRFKIHIFYQRHTLAMLFTYIPSVIPDPEELGLSREFINLVNRKNGLLVVAGYHGSGRTSTVLSLLNYLNKTQTKYILTLEQPIEYILTSELSIIEQREIGRDSDSFLAALKFAKDSDVDVVAVSAVDDLPTLQSIFELVASGRLVIIITEAESVAGAIDNLVQLASDQNRDQLKDAFSDQLLGAVVQQLLPRRGGGSVTVMEILIANSASRALIKEGRYAQITSIIQTSRDEGMRSLDQALLELVKTGEVDYAHALAVAVDKTNFQVSAQKFSTPN